MTKEKLIKRIKLLEDDIHFVGAAEGLAILAKIRKLKKQLRSLEEK